METRRTGFSTFLPARRPDHDDRELSVSLMPLQFDKLHELLPRPKLVGNCKQLHTCSGIRRFGFFAVMMIGLWIRGKVELSIPGRGVFAKTKTQRSRAWVQDPQEAQPHSDH
jgi:hypothetical protein